MDWSLLLSDARFRRMDRKSMPGRSHFVQDYDRIVFSAPFRRLANKTQVQPLYEHDHVHHRLIHSIEVSSVGRSLAMGVGLELERLGEIAPGEASKLSDIVQAAAVAHDIGNPPFGHSGEEAMGAWFAEAFEARAGLAGDLDPVLRSEFTKFEGNAQGYRILTQLEMARGDGGMQLALATLGAFTKYPCTSALREKMAAAGQASYVGLKKFGIFSTEIDGFIEVAEALDLHKNSHEGESWWCRHPLVFLVEAADDICYLIVDLEDAFTTGELPFETVRDLLFDAAGSPNRDASGLSQSEQIALYRAVGIGKAVDSCVSAFIENYDAIMAGRFSGALIDHGPMASQFAKIRSLARDQVYTAKRKTELEVSGRRVIGNVMSGVMPVFEDLAAKGWEVENLSGANAQLARALALDLRGVTSPVEALHAMADFVSGMTDRYAVSVSDMLSGRLRR